jgi:hypothetical protein
MCSSTSIYSLWDIVDIEAAVSHKVDLFDGQFHLMYVIGDIFIHPWQRSCGIVCVGR